MSGDADSLITVWYTDHEINRTVTKAFIQNVKCRYFSVSDYAGHPDRCVSYGILRGTGDIFRDCQKAGIDFWEIDKGFFKSNHYDGYYRISLNGMQPRFQELGCDGERWASLEIPIHPWRQNRPKRILICPPTEYIQWYYPCETKAWWESISWHAAERWELDKFKVDVRKKGSDVPLDDDLKNCHCVLTFNSNVAIDALRMGVPAITSDLSVVKSWNNLSLDDIQNDMTSFNRLKLFEYLAYCQFTLDEFRTGEAWSISKEIQGHSPSSSDGIGEKM